MSRHAHVVALWLVACALAAHSQDSDHLVLWKTGIKTASWKDLNAISLDIFEENLEAIAGTAPRLKKLKIKSAPALVSFVLNDATPELLQDRLLENCPALKVLILQYARARTLHPELLRGAKNLTHFTYAIGSITTLPPAFFSDNKRLQYISLKNNHLETLPRDIFSGLTDLRVLYLEENRLGSGELRALYPLVALNVLDLSENKLDDACTAENTAAISSLQNLQSLHMARTRATRVCADWLRVLRALKHLDLHHNDIRRVSCSDFRVPRASGVNTLLIYLTENPLEKFECSRSEAEDYYYHLSYKEVKLETDVNAAAKCRCHCPFLECSIKDSVEMQSVHPTLNLVCPSTVVDGTGDSEESVIPQCLPYSNSSCQLISTKPVEGVGLKDDKHVFSVNGQELQLDVIKCKHYRAWCSSIAVDDPAWPPFLHPVRFDEVTFTGCTPPTNSYAAALEALNLTLTSKLSLWDLTHVTAGMLKGLPPTLRTLELSSYKTLDSNPGVLLLEPEALSVLDGLRALSLRHVRADEIPAHLDHLELRHTGIEVFPSKAYDVKSLTLQEDHITSIKGSTPRLEKLLLFTPALVTLVLDNAAPLQLHRGFVAKCSELEELELTGVLTDILPSGFLSGVTKLTHFTYTQGNIFTLPSALFSDSKRLQTINLSRNKLEVLPRELFLGLTELRVLQLENNLLSAYVLSSLVPLVALTKLDLSQNPLGDHCSGNILELPPLQQLQDLSLAHTNTPRVCGTWLSKLRALQRLDFHGNQIRSVACADFRVVRESTVDITTVNMTGNPLEQFDCSQSDPKADYLAFSQKLLLIFRLVLDTSATNCSCACPFVACDKIVQKVAPVCKVSSNPIVPQCPPQANQNCQKKDELEIPDPKKDYEVNGEKLQLEVSECEQYTAWCSSTAVDDPAWPRLPRLVSVNDVSFIACKPPAGSYTAALKALNVTVTRSLSLWDLPPTVNISANSFADLPPSLQTLDLSGFNKLDATGKPVFRTLELKPGALAALAGIRTLKIRHLHADLLPPHLDRLELRDTGAVVFSPEAFNLVSLTLQEDHITTINGSVPRLQKLLLFAPALVSLVLYDAEPLELRNGFVAQCPSLQILELRKVRAEVLPAELLRGAVSLTNFTYTHGKINKLPQTLFSNLTRLQHVDLSHNKLESLDSEVFSGLPELHVLRFDHNTLSARDLRALSPVASTLTLLSFSGNDLVDLCLSENSSKLPSLKKLKELYLARTFLKKMCSAWLSELHSLKYLDLQENDLHHMACEDLRIQRISNTNVTVVNLRNNPLEKFQCFPREQTDSFLTLKQMLLVTTSAVDCNCNCPYANCIQGGVVY